MDVKEIVHQSKQDICDRIHTIHSSRTDIHTTSFFHYATILPSGTDSGWFEKGGFWNKQ